MEAIIVAFKSLTISQFRALEGRDGVVFYLQSFLISPSSKKYFFPLQSDRYFDDILCGISINEQQSK